MIKSIECLDHSWPDSCQWACYANIRILESDIQPCTLKLNYLEGSVCRVVEHLDGDVADAVERGQPRQVEVRDGERGAAVVDGVVAQQVGVVAHGAHLAPHLGDRHVQRRD